MNNREWLDTLSDEEYAKEWLKIEKMLHGDCGFHIEVIMEWLSQPHSTTADEDFAEIGFELTSKPSVSSYLTYRDLSNRIFYINNDGNNEYDVDEDGGEVWNDKLIDQIRKIADKKRKELGWNK